MAAHEEIAGPPRLVVFDAIETMFSLSPVRDHLERAGASAQALDVWFARMLRDAFALGAVGDYAGFRDVAEPSLRTVLADEGVAPSDEVVNGAFDAFRHMPSHDDVRPAMELAAGQGAHIQVLTNGTPDTTEHLVRTAGLDDLVDDVLTVHDVGRWKPAAEPYRHAVARAGVLPEQAALVAVHGWDICGARHAGLRTGWCARLEHELSPPLGPADVEGTTLDEVVAGLL